MKRCSICMAERQQSEFYRHRETRDRLFPYCKPCANARQSASPSRVARRQPSDRALRRELLRFIGFWECRKCEAIKPEDEFVLVGGMRVSPCTSCVSAHNKAKYVPHPKVRGANLDMEKFRANKKRRKARERGAAVSDFTAAQWAAMKEAFAGCCAYCQKPCERLTQDHVIPLSKGGEHTASNIVPACHSCNSRKSARDASEFIALTQLAAG